MIVIEQITISLEDNFVQKYAEEYLQNLPRIEFLNSHPAKEFFVLLAFHLLVLHGFDQYYQASVHSLLTSTIDKSQ